MVSNYTIDNLVALSASAQIKGPLFFSGVTSGVPSLDRQLEGSGANALHVAISLCESVDVYGIGLHGRGPANDKVYIHATDALGAGQCATNHFSTTGSFCSPPLANNRSGTRSRGHTYAREAPQVAPSVGQAHGGFDPRRSEPCGFPFKRSASSRRLYRQWIHDRVHSELLMHVIAALGFVQWK